VQANSTGGPGSRRAVAPSGDDSDNDDGCPSRNVTVARMAPLTELTLCQSDGTCKHRISACSLTANIVCKDVETLGHIIHL
jgi:hypothetical protein